jgi:hypothetical protein
VSRDVLATLLESAEPSIRWKTRVRVLGESPRSRSLQRLREEIRGSATVRALLSRRTQLGRAGTARQIYYKWQGLHWVLTTLADLGYPPGDKSLFPIRDRILDFWTRPIYFHEFEARTKQAAYRQRGVPVMQGRHRRCASQQATALRSVMALGIADERVYTLVERLLRWQWPDGGWNCDRDPSADTSSFHETWIPVIALAAYGRENRHTGAAIAAERAADVFLRRRLFKRMRDGRVIHPDFVALHYPHYWHYDVLAGLTAMAEVGKIKDPRCADALDLLEEKRLRSGGWPAERRYYTKVSRRALLPGADYVNWGGTSGSRMNEWVTVEALAVLQAAGRLRA